MKNKSFDQMAVKLKFYFSKAYSVLLNSGPRTLLVKAFFFAWSVLKNRKTPKRQVFEGQYNVNQLWVNEQTMNLFPKLAKDKSIALHIHLFHEDQVDSTIEYLKNLPTGSDVFISLRQESFLEATDLERRIRSNVGTLGKIQIIKVLNLGRDLKPLFLEFRERLIGYDLIGHVHTKKTSHLPEELSSLWNNALWEGLLGPIYNPKGKEILNRLLGLLHESGSVVYPDAPMVYQEDSTGWAQNFSSAQKLANLYLDGQKLNPKFIEFPRGSMFWATNKAFRGLMRMQLREEQIPQEPLADDGTILHAMERLILVATNLPGKIAYKVMSDKFDRKLTYYENQLDFETQLKDYSGPKVYSFYLPQFHAIAENDLWHGKGFTEWVKVRSAQPLFEGHYQQHVPHPDFGYYEHTEDSEIFSKQARAMKNAGVDGQIFYHYWFQGKLILEGPAKRLLEDASIDMPFAFCWANENWTRRWDGLEDDVLLRQDYDPDDATNFIRYLIPFFKDSRYIRRDGSVLLIVYNADKNPLMKEYASIWERECASEGISIHLVYVLRGEAKHPAEFGMSAALERPLSNWAYGRIRDIRKELHPYSTLEADILSYSDVVSYYKRGVPTKDFEVVPSLLPGFDNTARYGGNAHVVHESLPDMFYDWLRDTIDRAQELSNKNRFVVINAWNEWAEGAHLEPDLRFGYAFLNAVGRAKLDISGD